MHIDVWSDIVCPWCYIGKRRLERALTQFEQADQVQVSWRSFQLDPSFPPGVHRPVHQHLAEKLGTSSASAKEMTDQVKAVAAKEGLAFAAERAQMVNTFDAHRLAHLAGQHGLLTPMQERLMQAHHVEGEILHDHPTLQRLGVDVGVPAAELTQMLSSDQYAAAVQEDIQQARQLGVTGVPFILIAGEHAVTGAQSAETLLSALRNAAAGSARHTTAS